MDNEFAFWVIDPIIYTLLQKNMAIHRYFPTYKFVVYQKQVQQESYSEDAFSKKTKLGLLKWLLIGHEILFFLFSFITFAIFLIARYLEYVKNLNEDNAAIDQYIQSFMK